MSDIDSIFDKLNELEKKVENLTKIPTFHFALREDLKDEKQFLPTKAEPEASGYDVRAAQKDRNPIIIKPFQYVKIPLGFRGFCPPGYWYELKPRSSSFAKKSLHALYGTIDETYPDELVFAAQYLPEVIYNSVVGVQSHQDYCMNNELVINFGDAIGQIIPVKRVEMTGLEIDNKKMDIELLNRNATRKGGFGSTDKK